MWFKSTFFIFLKEICQMKFNHAMTIQGHQDINVLPCQLQYSDCPRRHGPVLAVPSNDSRAGYILTNWIYFLWLFFLFPSSKLLLVIYTWNWEPDNEAFKIAYDWKLKMKLPRKKYVKRQTHGYLWVETLTVFLLPHYFSVIIMRNFIIA